MKFKVLLKSTVAVAVMATAFYSTALSAAPSAPVVTKNAVQVVTTPVTAKAFDAVAPAQPEQGKIVEFKLEAKRATMEVAPGDVREVWTFNGQVPAPTLRVHQGDTVRFTLENKDPEMAHGLDFHFAKLDMGTYHKPIQPGESVTFDVTADYPGVFYFHCSADPVIMHIANGMFGAVIVDPPGYTPSGKEYVMIQHEWYKNGTDLDELINGTAQYVAFNGVASQYVANPLTANPGENVRIYFVNAGINNFSSFHIIGTIFDKATPDGNPNNTLYGVQTIAVAPGATVVVDTVNDTGTYAILSHSMKDAMKGALGLLKVGNPGAADASSHGASNDSMANMDHGAATTPAPAPATKPAAAPAGDAVSANAVTVKMANFAFSPKTLTIKAGTTVTWVNDEATIHSVVSDGVFDSRDQKADGMAKGDKFSYTFTTPGTYKIHCSFHPFMTQTITVN